MSTPTNKLFIPLTRRPPRETLLLAHPWFLRGSDEVPVTAAPRLLQFTNDDFVNGFLAGVEASTGAQDVNPFERLLTYRDYAEPPASMLDEHGSPLYPDSVVHDGHPANSLDQDPNSEKPTISWLRKLYLPLHCHFHIVALELHCRRAGFPRLSPDRVLEAGMVIRRLVADRDRQRWEDWLPVSADKGVWLEIADADMRPLGQGMQVPVLDPRAIAARLPAVAESELRARAELAEDAPLPDSLQAERLSLLPPSIGEAAKHSAWFGYLPLSSSAFQLPPFADPVDLHATEIATLLRQRAVDRLRAEWLGQQSPAATDSATFVERLRRSIQQPLRELLELLLLPLRPASAEVEDARAAIVLPRSIDSTLRPASDDPAQSVRRTLQHVLWMQSESPSSGEDWWPQVAAVSISESRANHPVDANWNVSHFYPAFDTDLGVLLRHHLHEIVDHCAPASGVPSADANTDVDVQQLLGVLLMRVRACRKELMRQIHELVLPADEQPDLNREFPESQDDGADDYPVVTAGSLSDEIEAWLSADSSAARKEIPRPWQPLIPDSPENPKVALVLVVVHRKARELEQVLAEVNERGAAAGNAYLEEASARRQLANGSLRARVKETLLPGGIPRSPGDELRIIGLDLAAQPEMGLLVFPGPAPTVATVEDMIDGVVGRYTASGSPVPSIESQRSEAAQLLNLVRPRLDTDSLYAVWCFVRVAGRDACEAEQLLWTPGSEVFSLAEPTDILGVKPVAMQLPDLRKLVRDIPRIPKARANPFAAVNIPADSGIDTGDDVADTARQWGVQMICSYGIPVFTICAWALFSVILSILLIIPGFGWLLLLKFCLPAPAKK